MSQLNIQIAARLCEPETAHVIEFARQWYLAHTSENFKGRELSDICGATLGSWAFIQQHEASSPKVRVFNPEYQKHGWQLGHTVVAIIVRNIPFIRESVRGELNRRNLTIHNLHSTIFSVVRDEAGQLQQLLPIQSEIDPPDNYRCSEDVLLHIELGRCSDVKELRDITTTLTEILAEVATVVDDFPAMTSRAQGALADAGDLPEDEKFAKVEVQAFIRWMLADHFTFLGYEELTISHDSGEPIVSVVSGSELGLLKRRGSSGSIDLLNAIKSSRGSREHIDQALLFAKSSFRSRIHRTVYPDYVMLRCFDEEGRLVRKHRFLGMYTSKVYTLSPTLIPLLRGKVSAVIERSGLNVENHEGKELAKVLDRFPRAELFQSSIRDLFNTSMAVNKIQERRQIRLFVRYDMYRKFVSCLVYTPKDIYRTDLRLKVEKLLCDAFGAEESEFTTFFSESILARTHFVLRVNPDNEFDVNIKALEEEVLQVTMTWKEHLNNHLVEEYGEEQGAKLLDQYGEAFSPGYMDDFEPRAAISDIVKIASLTSADDIAMSFYRRLGEPEKTVRFRLVHLDKPLSLSDVMPILENLGLRVESDHPYGIKRKDGRRIWVHEFSLTYDLNADVDLNNVSETFQEAFIRIWQGDAESDPFNKLILGSRLGWRQIAMLRAYSRYMKQIKFDFSGSYIAETLSNHLPITGKIVDFFNARFDGQLQADNEDRQCREDELERSIIEALEEVENLNEDRVIRHYLSIIKATLRTNYFQCDENGNLKNYFSFKLSPKSIPDMPLPVPMFEIFVYSPSVEGVHLRGGKVARGGLRWSDRFEDFRTEVLGLVKAQQVKNAVIVPMGAKGGFVAKQLPTEGGREAFQEEGVNCYKIFIQALLDVTDNLIDGNVIPPRSVIRKDEDDTYLVVAADKGTATFSDIANQLAVRSGFWLGDAFASGGSAGYDHKKMGITAKGAWVSVQRHFRELGTNIQETDFTVVGVGDMAGDVFGNGMLLSKHIELVCAFNHLHIFIDPNPDSASSYVERKRLFELPRSSWDDYEENLISSGGGIFRRAAKSITISPEMKKRFDISADKLTPTELISAVLKAPVDLFWNGGIGTYVKSSQESHADVGDKANDILRVDARELRCKVIGEGGNLGVTQLSRVEFALHGGRSNTDFIDNAAGVDCSDHEVNIKILLNAVVTNNDMTEKQRNSLLEEMTDSVSELVLENNYRQTQAISLAEREAIMRSGEYRRLIQSMESSGKLNRELEFIPADDELLERKASGTGLTRPELSVLISYVKSQLKEELAETSIPNDIYMLDAVEMGFPQKLRDGFNSLIHSHRLRKEIIATQLANDMVNHMGITFVDRIAQSTGSNSGDIVRAYVTARDVFDMPYLWQQIEALDYQVDANVQLELMAELMRLVRRASRWFIRNRRGLIEPAVEVKNFKQEIALLREALPDIIRGDLKEARYKNCQRYIEQGVPEELATTIASMQQLYPFLSIIEASQAIDAPSVKVAELFFCLADKLELDWFAKQISELKIENYWQAMARETYRDDLEWQLRTLTEGAMRHICEKGEVEACIERWMDQQHLLVARWRLMVAELQATEVHEFAMYSVAIRELLDLAQSSKFGDVA
jgi:glutamate dehydrogenase